MFFMSLPELPPPPTPVAAVRRCYLASCYQKPKPPAPTTNKPKPKPRTTPKPAPTPRGGDRNVEDFIRNAPPTINR